MGRKMTKLCFAVLLALSAMTGTALAVDVDFSVLGEEVVDLSTTFNPAGLTLNGVTFRYDPLESLYDLAAADAFGIFGTTYGKMVLDFDQPVSGLSLNFLLWNVPGALPNNMVGVFGSSAPVNFPGSFVVFEPGLGDAEGILNYNGPAFTQASLYFNPKAELIEDEGAYMPFVFTMDNIAYTPNAVPEPISASLFLLGGSALAVARRKKAKA